MEPKAHRSGLDVLTSPRRRISSSSSINGLPAITCGGSGSGLFLENTSTNLVSSLATRSVIVVCKMSNTASGTAFSFRRTTTFSAMSWSLISGSNFIYSDGVNGLSNQTVPTSPSTATPYALEWSFDGTTGHNLTFAHNGTSETVSSTSGVQSETGTTGFTVGAREDVPTQSFAGDIAEILVYDHVLSAPDVAALRAYLQNRYGMTISGAGSATEAIQLGLTTGAGLSVVSSALALTGQGMTQLGWTDSGTVPAPVAEHQATSRRNRTGK